MTPTALMKRRGSHLVCEAWTDFGGVGAYRTAVLTQIDNFRQGLAHPRLDPTGYIFVLLVTIDLSVSAYPVDV